jgi:23S rRNA (pseudouridine1915-N3)-methyltransferase
VGGAFGIDPDLVRKARAILPLSRLTLPHQLARLVLCEQVYRAVAALHGVAYAK